MRKQFLPWMIVVFGVIATAYGGYSFVYSYNHGKNPSALAIILLVFGVIALVFSLVLYILYFISQKRKKERPNPIVEEVEEEPTNEETKPAPEAKNSAEPNQKDRVEYVSRKESPNVSYYDNAVSTVYVKLVGHGPILRVDNNRILDMRNNTYYRIEGNMVKQEGNGPLYEIRGNQIKNAFGGYLYEISGSNINKVYGGFYASISGNYITMHDLSNKYEMSGSLSKTQILAVAVLLFGKY